MIRHLLLFMLAVIAPLLDPGMEALAQAERLPQRNLLIELRQTDGSSASASGGGLRSGTVIVGPNGEVQARGEVGVGTRQIERGSEGVGALRVLNGGQGMLSTGFSVPLTWYSVVWTPSGPGLVGTPGLVDVGRRVAVRPRWPGGNAPVTVEIRSEASAMAGGAMPSRFGLDGQPLPDNSTESAGLLTTLQLPLGEWVTVAGSTSAESRSERGSVYSTQSRAQGQSLLQMRVTAP
jgi:hypothetical protein